ncbi:hypothetical protein D3870_13155 [Noviherbaspirillum cavernae]|uniref:Type IV pilus modification protein PilV n=1 Tax=Noviherbaspirillum cavernae TaxID=2320862 RepID=A0A418X2Z8_9BURK|nr:prepilin-type N-terminal cleavage/methylation domain-containing protein [Noviherbaspirillum cavernae]RJG06826.1 hypothetical protein D3870_13155 [Noviherbaspirillum cavernae]
MHRYARLPLRKNQDGIALIEALIAIFLFSLGILALVGLQAVMSKNVTEAKLRGEASFLANQLIGQMWADLPNLASYAMTANGCTTSTYASCTAWRSMVQQMLPNGAANVTVNGSDVSISLSWQMPGETVPARFAIDANITN